MKLGKRNKNGWADIIKICSGVQMSRFESELTYARTRAQNYSKCSRLTPKLRLLIANLAFVLIVLLKNSIATTMKLPPCASNNHEASSMCKNDKGIFLKVSSCLIPPSSHLHST
ncbi:unnamed protein product [Cuscuta europaea]|uniref:Uncharacterized protein n=1 Tax=Cuscuta europaea TaxID=41803 RepID=A0A9P0YWM5_CUSEU|nr:unnamed protein product [Cuscuta europaea]